MNIFASNDDGIDCEGIHALAGALRARGHRVLVVVPDRNRSGQSHAITFETELALEEVGPDTWICAGTPCDCMLTVLIKGGFDFVPDVVVSGINDGENLGTDLLYSGTAAVARQAGLAEIPGLAFSLHHNSRKSREWERAARWSIENFDLLLSLWQKNIFVNVNYPNTPDFSDWCFTYPSFREYEDMMQIAVQADGTKTARLRGGKAIRREQKLKALAHPVLKGGTGGGLPSGAAMEKSRLPIISDWDAIIENKVSVSLVCNHPVIMPFAAE